MRKIHVFAFAAFLSPFLAQAAPYVANQTKPERVIEDFSDSKTGDFPKDFRTYPFQHGKAERVYRVQEEAGNKYLNGTDKEDISVQTFKRFYWDTDKWPYLSWKWRVQTLPKGADERNWQTNDSACGIYVVFGGYTGNVLKYVWSTTVPAGTVVEKEAGKFYMIVLQSGKRWVGTWKEENVNVVEDYQKVFKEKTSRFPSGFGLLTDGNAVHAAASCDYDDFQISESAAKK